jgi:hypothetical protein
MSSRRDVLAAVLLIAISGIVTFAVLVWSAGTNPRSGAGFGPDWQCADVAKGGQVCVKKPLGNSGNTAAPSR